jgi:hypothetical protein
MLNGKSSMTNSKKLLMSEHKLFYPNYPSEILPHNILLTEIFSAPAESPMKTSKELSNQPEPPFKLPSTELKLLVSDLVENSKKSKSVLKDTIYSRNVLKVEVPLLF